MKVLSIIGIILSPIVSLLSLVFMVAIAKWRMAMYQGTATYDNDIVYRAMEKSILSMTSNIGWISLGVMGYYITLYIVSMQKVKNNIVKSIGIIGIILSVLMICWDIVMMGAPMAISFDEVGVAWLAYFMTCLAFSIVMLVQCTKSLPKHKLSPKENVLDDLEFE